MSIVIDQILAKGGILQDIGEQCKLIFESSQKDPPHTSHYHFDLFSPRKTVKIDVAGLGLSATLGL